MNTVGRSDGELTLLYSLLPRIEAYREILDRHSGSTLTPIRGQYLTLAVTGDEELAEQVFCDLSFQKPLE